MDDSRQAFDQWFKDKHFGAKCKNYEYERASWEAWEGALQYRNKHSGHGPAYGLPPLSGSGLPALDDLPSQNSGRRFAEPVGANSRCNIEYTGPTKNSGGNVRCDDNGKIIEELSCGGGGSYKNQDGNNENITVYARDPLDGRSGGNGGGKPPKNSDLGSQNPDPRMNLITGIPPKTSVGIPIVIDPRVPEGEAHIKDASGKTVGVITDISTERLVK